MSAVFEATALPRRFGGRCAVDPVDLSHSARIAGVVLPGQAEARAMLGITIPCPLEE